MNTAQPSNSLGSPPRLPPTGPSLLAPLLVTVISLAVAVGLTAFSFIHDVPHLSDLFREMSSGGPSDMQAIRAPIRNILSPGMFVAGFVAVLAFFVFSIASLWLLIATIIRLARR